MMTPKAGLRELVHELRATLDAIAAGLVDGQPDRLLAAEPTLAALASALAHPSRHPDDRPSRADLLAARDAVRRCEALGLTLSMLGEVYAARQGYTRSGHFPTAEAPGVLEARV